MGPGWRRRSAWNGPWRDRGRLFEDDGARTRLVGETCFGTVVAMSPGTAPMRRGKGVTVMVNVNNSTAQNPMMDALSRLTGSVFGEAGRAASELGQHAVTDINSIGTAMETGGFLGGVMQAFDKLSLGNAAGKLLDAATGPGKLSPQVKEGVAAAVNLYVGNPIGLKDLFDMATAPAQPGVRPAPANSVPPPNVDQLRGGQPPSAPDRADHTGRSGYADSPAPPRSRTEITIVVNETAMPLNDFLGALETLRNDPTIKANAPEIYAVLNDPNATLQDIGMVISADALRRCPDVLPKVIDRFPGEIGNADDVSFRVINDRVAVDPTQPAEAAAPTAPVQAPGTGQGDFSNFMQQAMGIFGQLAGPLGMGMQMLGGLLSNPLVANFIAPLLVQGLNFLVPGLGVALAPVLPVLLPLAGQALSAGGGMLAGSAPGAGGAPAGGSPDALGGLLNTVVGAFAGGGAPALPIGAIGLAG